MFKFATHECTYNKIIKKNYYLVFKINNNNNNLFSSNVYPKNWLFIYRNLTNYKYNRNLEIH